MQVTHEGEFWTTCPSLEETNRDSVSRKKQDRERIHLTTAQQSSAKLYVKVEVNTSSRKTNNC